MRERVSVQSHLGPKREVRNVPVGTVVPATTSPFVVVQDYLAYRGRTLIGMDRDLVTGGFSGQLLDKMVALLEHLQGARGVGCENGSEAEESATDKAD